MATLVTDSSGFIGANVVKVLLEHGHEVVCFDLDTAASLMPRFVAVAKKARGHP